MLMDGQFGFPAGTGLDAGFFPRGVGLTPVAMQMTASQGGISAIAAAQDQEEERRRRIESIVGSLSTRWGFVSQEGVERCARRLGLECMWEESMGEERQRKLIIAGHGVLVDVEFRGHEVRDVVLQLEGSMESVVTSAGAASEVLKQNLHGDEGSAYVILDGFMENMERLASMDRLGGPEVNCFDAVEGIHLSLQRIHAWEVGRSKQEGKQEATTDVMCQQNGRPRMHTGGRIGLAVQYWMDRRFASGEKTTPGAMDIDTVEGAEDEDDLTIWSFLVDCEASPAELYPPIRISDEWVSEAVETPASTNILPDASPIDWQDPPPTLLPPKSPTNGAGVLDIEGTLLPKSPDVHFVAKFEPPVIVPLQTAIQIHASVGSPLPQESLLPTTFESLIFPDADNPNTLPTAPRSVENALTSYDPTTSTSTRHKHKSTLFTQQNDYARAITHLPFSHPRQIIALLSTLRQWILTISLLRRSFISEPSEQTSSPITTNGDTQPPAQTTDSATFQTIDAELADFMSTPLPTDPPSASPTDPVRTIGITLTTAPSPHFNIHFPNPSLGGKPTTVSFNIGLNGTIEGVDVDDGNASIQISSAINGTENGEEEKLKMREKIKRVLEISESIGVCVEWIIKSTASSAD